MSRYTLFPERVTSDELITHVQSLLTIVRPEHLRRTEVHEALAQAADILGKNLSADEVRLVLAGQPRGNPRPVPRRKRT